MRKSSFATVGSTLVEAMLACGIVAIFLAGLYDMNWRGLFVLKSSIDVSSASELTTNLAEQIRTATWTQITDPAYLSGTIMANSTTVGHLPNVVQTITAYPYGSTLGNGETVQVQRDAGGNVATVLPGNGNLSAESSIQVDITVNWHSTFKSVPHTRVVRLIASQGGILGQN
ncbi:hypothetical protein CfE428DRAFT_4995 [Chthoniobacter flavus Ellin428]|uniref:Uncharacterized protein n=1 Tax=Chthoniobacter flavus Ellin428 TaxID=497964 RepID=B4D7V5_9BACT|nr:hypothetical protein [Chthoniobacter flavus]EDY17478.1 hypothetical protein CfE428DRAFT_4995 [Chthoniobacter flavus Ellin428]TCO92274.1 hypothetical protein EV701_10643 [Chthoniobacter flavus]